MDRALIAAHLAQLAPEVPPFNILRMIDMPQFRDMLADPRTRSADAAADIWHHMQPVWEARKAGKVAA